MLVVTRHSQHNLKYTSYSQHLLQTWDPLDCAGGVFMGKTNLDQFACGLVGTRTPYGVPANAFDDR